MYSLNDLMVPAPFLVLSLLNNFTTTKETFPSTWNMFVFFSFISEVYLGHSTI